MADDLLGLAELADALKVTKRTATTYTARSDFPEPIARLKAGPVWKRTDVEKWAKRTLPLPKGGSAPRRQ